jgi:hypothetical protein
VTAPSLVQPTLADSSAPAHDTGIPGAAARPVLDGLGATASIICAVHCVAVALLLGALPAIGALADPRIEWSFLAFSAVIGAWSLLPARRHHHDRAPLTAFLAGMLVLAATRLAGVSHPWIEALLVVIGASCIVWAHWRNRRLMAAHVCSHRAHAH